MGSESRSVAKVLPRFELVENKRVVSLTAVRPTGCGFLSRRVHCFCTGDRCRHGDRSHRKLFDPHF